MSLEQGDPAATEARPAVSQIAASLGIRTPW
jgi:hypothetical protein